MASGPVLMCVLGMRRGRSVSGGLSMGIVSMAEACERVEEVGDCPRLCKEVLYGRVRPACASWGCMEDRGLSVR